MTETVKDAPAQEQAPATETINPPEQDDPSRAAEHGESAGEADQQEDAGRDERRKSVRLTLKIPVTLSWVDELGESVKEITYTEEVSSFGCRVPVQKGLPSGQTVICVNNATRKGSRGKATWAESEGKEKGATAGLDLPELAPEFWGEEFLIALIDADALSPVQHPVVIEKHGEVRRGLLYALMATVLYFFLGGYSAWNVYFEVSPFVQNILAPGIFLSGIALAVYASIQAYSALHKPTKNPTPQP